MRNAVFQLLLLLQQGRNYIRSRRFVNWCRAKRVQ